MVTKWTAYHVKFNTEPDCKIFNVSIKVHGTEYVLDADDIIKALVFYIEENLQWEN